MDRREFIKLSALFSAALAVETNPIIKATAKTLGQTNDVVLYLLQQKSGKWKVRWTKHTTMTKKKIAVKNVNLETFKILEIVPEAIAEQRRRELWIEYGCSGYKGTPVDVDRTTNAGYYMTKHPNSIAYYKSDDLKENLKKICSKGGKMSKIWEHPANLAVRNSPAFREGHRKYVASGILQSDWWKEKASKGGNKTWQVQQERNFAPLKITATKHKMKNRERWLDILSNLPNRFTTQELMEVVSSKKVMHNIVNNSNLIVRVKHGVYEKNYCELY